mgnify:CR=1 FL=1
MLEKTKEKIFAFFKEKLKIAELLKEENNKLVDICEKAQVTRLTGFHRRFTVVTL